MMVASTSEPMHLRGAHLLHSALLVALVTGYQRSRVVLDRDGSLSNPETSLPLDHGAGGKRYRQNLTNYGDVQYVANISIGGQEVGGVLDTGSYDLLVLSTECTRCGNESLLYDVTQSKSYKMGELVAHHSFGSGETEGLEGFEQISVGPFEVPNQTFWEIIDANMSVLSDSHFQAIIGVGPPARTKMLAWKDANVAAESVAWYEKHHRPVPRRAKEAAKNSIQMAQHTSGQPALLESFEAARFSICLGKEVGSQGTFVWNDTDPELQPNLFKKLPVIGDYTWSVKMDSVGIAHNEGKKAGGTKAWSNPLKGIGTKKKGKDENLYKADPITIGCETGCPALIDSGTSLLVVPTAVAKKIEDALSNFGSDCGNIDRFPDLVFNIGGHELHLPPEQYLGEIVGTVPPTMEHWFGFGGYPFQVVCELELLMMAQDFDNEHGRMWILGMPFFRQFYTTFGLEPFDSEKNGGTQVKERSIHVAEGGDKCEPSAPSADDKSKDATSADAHSSIANSIKGTRSVTVPADGQLPAAIQVDNHESVQRSAKKDAQTPQAQPYGGKDPLAPLAWSPFTPEIQGDIQGQLENAFEEVVDRAFPGHPIRTLRRLVRGKPVRRIDANKIQVSRFVQKAAAKGYVEI